MKSRFYHLRAFADAAYTTDKSLGGWHTAKKVFELQALKQFSALGSFEPPMYGCRAINLNAIPGLTPRQIDLLATAKEHALAKTVEQPHVRIPCRHSDLGSMLAPSYHFLAVHVCV